MPSLSWNEIRQRAITFSREWAAATREQADKQSFWNEFFLVFGIPRRTVASFEEPVQRLKGTYGFIDLLWKGKLLVEHKTAGESLEAAETQAFDYIQSLESSGRGDEAPRYLILSDFQRLALFDLEPDEQLDLPLFRGRRFHRTEFPLADLHRHIRDFAFIPGYKVHTFKPQDPLNLKAVTIMAGLHDTLKAGGYSGHDLERFLVRVLFCLFAEDTGIFEPESFKLYIVNRTHPDGNDLGARLGELFRTLDTLEAARQVNLDQTLKDFPYINGELFRERLEFAAFNTPMRAALLNAANFDWSRISPAIFGALFQEVMKPKERRSIGAHYTSERDILKVIQPLFLDALQAEFEAIRSDRSGRKRTRLDDFRLKLTRLTFFDPACGCGNFLVIAYRELRALELEVLREQHGGQQALTLDEVNRLSQVDVHQFYGIEIEEWPARIAEVALWLMDHQSNLKINEAFGQPFTRLPLRNSPHIWVDNALRVDWNKLLPASECSYIMGNPPFVGHQWRSRTQIEDMTRVWGRSGRFGRLDYVTCWYKAACTYMAAVPSIKCAFVSTNSISQGEQVGILWGDLLALGIIICFAYRSFLWESEARAKAHVHCVIVGFSLTAPTYRFLYESATPTSQPVGSLANNINPYLVDAPNVILPSRSKTPRGIPSIIKGSQPTDGGFLILSSLERTVLLQDAPTAAKLVRPYMGGDELLNGGLRFCLWLTFKDATLIKGIRPVMERIKAVREARLKSSTKSVRDSAALPYLFTQIRQPDRRYLALPEVSSETRNYIPAAFLGPEIIASNKLQIIPNAQLWHFAIISSALHMAWMKVVSGRLESRYSYSPAVYNNFPWKDLSETQRGRLDEAAEEVLQARTESPNSTLATLYDPVLMPPDLRKAHQRLDRAVEKCYRPQPFANDRERVEFLFALYEQLTAPLLPAAPRPRKRAAKST